MTVVVTNSTVVRRLSVLLQQSAAAVESHHCHQFYLLHDPYHPTWEVSPPDQHNINKFITTMQGRERDLLDRDFTSCRDVWRKAVSDMPNFQNEKEGSIRGVQCLRRRIALSGNFGYEGTPPPPVD